MVIYWHLWFHEEPLTSMEPFLYTKDSFSGKRFFRIFLNTICIKKKYFF